MSQVLDLLINLKIGIGVAIGLGEVCEGIVEVGKKLRTDFGSAILQDNLN